MVRLGRGSSITNESKTYFTELREIRACRNCKYFMRVKEQRQTNHRGFCALGQNEGSYDLYIGTSYAKECPSFIIDNRKRRITLAEQDYNKREFEFAEEEATKLAKSICKSYKKDNPKERIRFFDEMMLGMELRGEFLQKFMFNNTKEWGEIYNMYDLTMEEYQGVLDMFRKLTNQLIENKKQVRKLKGEED